MATAYSPRPPFMPNPRQLSENAILLSQIVTGLAGPLLGDGLTSTLLILAAVAVLGAGAGWLVKVTWGKWTKAQ